jgi:hypothetical protein
VKAEDVGDALERACTAAAGRFETDWSYDDNGVQWGRLATCTTEEVRLSCQGSVCHAKRFAAIPPKVTQAKDKHSDARGVRVAATRAEFDQVLRPTATAMY